MKISHIIESYYKTYDKQIKNFNKYYKQNRDEILNKILIEAVKSATNMERKVVIPIELKYDKYYKLLEQKLVDEFCGRGAHIIVDIRSRSIILIFKNNISL